MSSAVDSAPSEPLGPGPNTTVRRRAARANYDRAQIHAIIDEALVCHVGFCVDGQVHLIPTAHARLGDHVLLHGAVANRMLQAVQGQTICLSFTLLDGLVFARSAFHHSMNYRAVVAYGVAREVTDPARKRRALDALVDHVAPGRSAELRPSTSEELGATRVVEVELSEASAKSRRGPPLDDEEEIAGSTVWAGVLPLALQAKPPERDVRCSLGVSAAVAARAADFGIERGSEVESGDGAVLLSSDRSRLDLAWVHEVLSRESYWARGLELERLRCSLQHSLCFGAYEGGRQVGFARVFSDGSRLGHLADVFIAEARRGRGLGRELVRFVLSHPTVCNLERLTLATRDAQGFYAALGFVPMSAGEGMVRKIG